jgi:hypothetical protein
MNKNQTILVFRLFSFLFLTFGYAWYIDTMVDYHSLVKYFSMHAYFLAWFYSLIVLLESIIKNPLIESTKSLVFRIGLPLNIMISIGFWVMVRELMDHLPSKFFII